MANQKISQMPSLTASELAAGDLLAVVDVSDVTQASSGSNKKITVTELQSAAVSAGTANGVLYLNGSKVATSGSALTYNGTNVQINASNFPSLKFGDSGATVKGELYYGVGGNDLNLVNYTNGPIGFITNGSEQMRLTSTGLGIGTSSPGAKLEINGDARLSNGSGFTTANSLVRKLDAVAGSANQYTIASIGFNTGAFVDQGNIVFNTNNSLGPQERLRIDPAGNLGLGVTPSAWGSSYKVFQNPAGGIAANSTVSIAYAQNAFDSGSGAWKYLNTGAAGFYNQFHGLHAWYTAPSGTAGEAITFTQAMTLDASGNLGVGTSSPGQRLEVADSSAGYVAIKFANSAASKGIISYSSDNLLFYTNNAERARIDSSGNLLVGASAAVDQSKVLIAYSGGSNQGLIFADSDSTSGNNAIRFKVTGSTVGSVTTSATATAYNTSSDYRLKNITGPVTNSGAYIDSLNPVEGTWKADGSTFVGLIAHEVQEVSRTQVATGVKDGEQMQAMDYSNSELIANLIAEVKSLRARVAALESN